MRPSLNYFGHLLIDIDCSSIVTFNGMHPIDDVYFQQAASVTAFVTLITETCRLSDNLFSFIGTF